jgi:uncharacterized SAM-binding protein YcdF (DUF218 family)
VKTWYWMTRSTSGKESLLKFLIRKYFCGFAVGCMVGCACSVVVPLLLYFYVIPSWLVVRTTPVKADAAIVLGGGGASRLKKGIALYDAGMVSELILVDNKVTDWKYITDRLCPDCDLSGKKVTVLTGSESTVTDARLTLPVCVEKDFKKILVITDPYHSRRADIIFHRMYKQSNISVEVVHSGDFGRLIPPDGGWRGDRNTRDTIWLETGKVLALLLPSFLTRTDSQ